jgi:hypothetical protein
MGSMSDRRQKGNAHGAQKTIGTARMIGAQHLAVVHRQNALDAVDVEAAQQLAHRHHLGMPVAIEFAVQLGQAVPGLGGLLVVRVVKTEVQPKHVQHRFVHPDHIAVGVGLLVDAITHLVGRDGLVIHDRVGIVGVLEAIGKPQHGDEEQVGQEVQQQCLQ